MSVQMLPVNLCLVYSTSHTSLNPSLFWSICPNCTYWCAPIESFLTFYLWQYQGTFCVYVCVYFLCMTVKKKIDKDFFFFFPFPKPLLYVCRVHTVCPAEYEAILAFSSLFVCGAIPVPYVMMCTLQPKGNFTACHYTNMTLFFKDMGK